MTDEKIIEALECCARLDYRNWDVCKTECPYNGKCYDEEKGINATADYLNLVKRQKAEIETLQALSLKWISVKDRLPEKHGSICVCLLKFPGAKQVFPYCLTWHAYGDNGYVNGPHFSDEGLDGLKVTHWMPLPQPPKGE